MDIINLDEVRKKLKEQQKELELSEKASAEDIVRTFMEMLLYSSKSQGELTIKVQEGLQKQIEELASTYGEAIKELQQQIDELRELVDKGKD